MKCEKCQDKGFIEENHGLVMILCDCDKAREVAEKHGIPWREPDDSDNRIRPDNQLTGSADTGKPKQSQKPKAKKKTRARSS